jgi:hypothetical protein
MSCVWSHFDNSGGRQQAAVGTRSNTPVFCDESGVRSIVVQWGGRGIGLLLLLLCAGLALTLQTRVEVPGLSRLLPVIDGSSELFHAPTRRSGQDRQPVGEGGVMIPNVSNQTVARARGLPVRKEDSVAPPVDPAAERPAVTWVQPTATSSATRPSAAPTAQSSPTGEPSPTAAGPTPSPTTTSAARPRNPNAAVPRENPNPQSSAAQAHAPGQLTAKSNGKAVGAPPPKVGAEPTTP